MRTAASKSREPREPTAEWTQVETQAFVTQVSVTQALSVATNPSARSPTAVAFANLDPPMCGMDSHAKNHSRAVVLGDASGSIATTLLIQYFKLWKIARRPTPIAKPTFARRPEVAGFPNRAAHRNCSAIIFAAKSPIATYPP